MKYKDWSSFESYVARLLKANLTKNSGAMNDDADLKDELCLIECKFRSSDTLTVDHNILSKVNDQSLKWNKDSWILAYANNRGAYAILPIEFFADIYNHYKESIKDNG